MKYNRKAKHKRRDCYIGWVDLYDYKGYKPYYNRRFRSLEDMYMKQERYDMLPYKIKVATSKMFMYYW